MAPLSFPAAPPDRVPPLEPDALHIWQIPLDVAAEHLPTLQQLLDDTERERAGRFHFDRDRRRFIVCRSAQRRILSHYCAGAAADLRFQYTSRGKPSLAGQSSSPSILFNISNSKDLALCAVAMRGDLGVDLEKIREMRDLRQLAAHFFAATEISELDELTGQRQLQAFFTIWTRKEAILKAVGTGLAFPLDQVVVTGNPDDNRLLKFGAGSTSAKWWLQSLAPGPGYVGAVATDFAPARTSCFSFDPASTLL